MDKSSSNNDAASALIISASDKAGMEGIERRRINSIILRESGKSSFMAQQHRKDQNVNEKIEIMREKMVEKEGHSSFHSWETESKHDEVLNARVNAFIRARRKKSTCVVVDMDSFYISCELLTKPHLKNVPACVGRSMVLTSNYCARRYGVRSAMAGFIADKLVSELSNQTVNLIHLPANFDLYKEKSKKMLQALSEYDPNLKSHSLDEAYLNIGPYLDLRVGGGWSHERTSSFLRSKFLNKKERNEIGMKQTITSPVSTTLSNEEYCEGKDMCNINSSLITMESINLIISEMRDKVKSITGGLTCSAGVAPNFLLAKIASDFNKPCGQLCISPEHEKIMSFMRDLPVRKISGIGRVTEKILQSFQINTGGDLFQQRAKVQFLFKTATANFLLRASLGWADDDDEDGDYLKEDLDKMQNNDVLDRKGISRERTFSPEGNWAEIQGKLQHITSLLSVDMEDRNVMARTVTLKVKLKTFEVFTKSKSLPLGQAFSSADFMFPTVMQLLSEVKKGYLLKSKGELKSTFIVRLLGVRCSNLLDRDDQKKVLHMENMDIQKFLTSDHTGKRKGNYECSGGNNDTSPQMYLHKSDLMSKDEHKRHGKPKMITNKMQTANSTLCMNRCIKKEHSGATKEVSSFSPIIVNPYKKKKSTVNILSREEDDLNSSTDCVRSPSIKPLSASFRSIQSPKSSKQNELGSVVSRSPFESNATMLPKTNTKQEVTCPICKITLSNSDNEMMNQHVDACLNRSLIRRMVQEESEDPKHMSNHRKKQLLYFFSSCRKNSF